VAFVSLQSSHKTLLSENRLEGAGHATVQNIAVFPILADVVEVKTGSRSTAHWRIHFIWLNGWLRHSFAQFITLLDIDGIGQNWEDSNIAIYIHTDRRKHTPSLHTKAREPASRRLGRRARGRREHVVD